MQKVSVRADVWLKVRRLLRRHGYPPDKRKSAVVCMLQHVEAVARDRSRPA